MPVEDALRWNNRYREGFSVKVSEPRSLLADALPHFSEGSRILDLAMGLGVNSRWLVQHGFKVVGVDISAEAVQYAKRNEPGLLAVIADLADFSFPRHYFSGIINFYYLNRDLIKDFPNLLVSDGIAVVETLTVDMLALKPEIPRDYLLEQGELFELFNKWEVLQYFEGWLESAHGGRKSIAQVIARYHE